MSTENPVGFVQIGFHQTRCETGLQRAIDASIDVEFRAGLGHRRLATQQHRRIVEEATIRPT